VVRLDGHSARWDINDIHERFGYRYSETELREWAPKIAARARDTTETHVLFNNCHRDYARPAPSDSPPCYRQATCPDGPWPGREQPDIDPAAPAYHCRGAGTAVPFLPCAGPRG
jgi:Protein of unknown function DUF72